MPVTPYATDIYLVRHGHTISEGRVLGQAEKWNEGLSQTGIEEAENLAEVMRSSGITPAAIFSSPLTRALETARKVNEVFVLPEVYVRAGLKEIGMGSSEGLTLEQKREKYQERQAEIREQYPDREERWMHQVVGESMGSLHSRVIMELVSIAEEHQNKVVLAFSHGKVAAAIISDCFEIDEDQPECRIDHCRVVHLQISRDEQNVQYIQVINRDWNAMTRKHSRHDNGEACAQSPPSARASEQREIVLRRKSSSTGHRSSTSTHGTRSAVTLPTADGQRENRWHCNLL